MVRQISRRRFLLRSVEGVALVALPPAKVALAPAHRPLRLGILGLGRRGSALLAACESSNVRVVALCDREPTALRQAAGFVPNVRQFSAAPKMLQEDTVDGLAIGIPEGLDWAARALESGRHVLLVPPVACSPTKALGLARIAAARRVQFGLAPEDLSWNTNDVDHILQSAGQISSGPVRLSVRSAALTGPDLLHNAVRLLPNESPESVFAMQAGTPWGNACSAVFRFRGATTLDVHSRSLRQMHADLLEIQADIPVAGRNVRLTIESRTEQIESAAMRSDVPALVAFALDASKAYHGLSRQSRYALTTLQWTALVSQSLSTGGIVFAPNASV